MFHLSSFPSRAALALSLMTALSAQAQYTSDIDIYSGDSATDRPNVLILLDNTANWTTAFQNEMAALKSTIAGLTDNKFNVGLMLFTETGAPNTGDDGGYVRAAIRTMDSNYKTKFQAMLNGFDVGGDKSNGGKAGKTMAEAYYYFTGSAPNSGNNKVKTDYTGNTSGTPSSNAIYSSPGNALASFSATQYVPPDSGVCARNYVIYISNGAVQDNNSDNTNASNRLAAAYAAASMARPADITGLSPNSSQENFADEWARFMRNSPSNITTYTVDVDKVTTGQGPGWSALLRSMAQQSGGEYFSVSSSGSELADKLSSIFNQIQSVDSVFSSASLPVSTSARGSFDNQVFMGMFRPDRDSHPRWRGNLKQYQFKYDPITDTLALVGADGEAAIGDKGFISTSAVSFWTSSSTFWSNQQLGTPPSSSDRPDGEVVEKGGVAQLIRTANATTQANRNLYTCISCAAKTNLSSTADAKFSTANSKITAISSNTTERDQIISWIRGTDNAGDENGPGGTTTIRPSVHGDVLHSRPAVVNYGGTTGVVVFYGSNDGMLRAISGKQTGTGAGQELWGFIPEEHFPKLKRLRDNTPKIRISTTDMPASDLPQLRDYFVDGPIGLYQGKNAEGNNITHLYAAMRRGGRFIYALDVTDPTAPVFLWKKSYKDTNFEKMGQTWSEPVVAKIKGNTNPVIIMGAGYDADAEDLVTAGTTTMGNAVLILDAFTGAHLKTLNTTRSVAADVNVADSDSDGYVDRAYAVDTGGNIYRIDLETPSSSDTSVWKIYTLAELSDASTTRKFFYRPDVLRTAKFTAIMVGSGDREKPLYTSSNDAFFTVFDERVSKGAPAEAPTTIKKSELRKVGSTEEPNPSLAKGCFIPLAKGEKVVNASTTFLGTTYFGTNQPDDGSNRLACTANLGLAKTYAAELFCKTPESQKLEGGGLPPSPVAGFVTVTYTPPGSNTPITSQKPFVIGKPNPKKSPLQASLPPGKLTIPQRRQYWYQQNAR